MISFFLKNFKSPFGKNHIREMYRFESGEKRKNDRGEFIDPLIVEGIVEEEIIKQHPDEYKAFKDLVDGNQDEMYQAVIAESEKEGEK